MKILMILFALVAGTGAGLSIGCGSKGGGGIGVKPCDDYISKLESCGAKVGGKDGDQMKSMAKMMRTAWAKDAKNPDAKKYLAETCESSLEDLAKQLPDACE
jgi:hypothetical protein